ncbi:helix-turn-helix domain-containing protein [Micromonospora sp. NPDC005979]|uniref:TetR/AcrR family transcriptional regulator n=1 Tax=Micromonospora sp. NPDC005979 TaxID=3156726 RepID=UPI00339E39B6
MPRLAPVTRLVVPSIVSMVSPSCRVSKQVPRSDPRRTPGNGLRCRGVRLLHFLMRRNVRAYARLMRWDAEEKRRRILAAARRAFAEKGEDVTVARIARSAGVSVATVYRRFPTRDSLITDAYGDQWNDCAAMHAEALRDPDPARALRELIRTLCAYQVQDRGFTRATSRRWSPDAGSTTSGRRPNGSSLSCCGRHRRWAPSAPT